MKRELVAQMLQSARGLLRVLGCAAGDRGGHKGNNRPPTQNERRVVRLIALLESPSGISNSKLPLSSESAVTDLETMLAIANVVAPPEGDHVEECAEYLHQIRTAVLQLLGRAPAQEEIEVAENATAATT